MGGAPRMEIGHGNGHNKQSLVRYVRKSNSTSFSLNEQEKIEDDVRRVMESTHRMVVAGRGWTEPRGRAHSTAIVTRNNLPNVGEMTRKVSERVLDYHRLAPDRVLVCSMFEHDVATRAKLDGVAHFALHPDAGPWLKDATKIDHPVVQEYIEAMESTKRFMLAARRDGLGIVLTGDLQFHASGPNVPWHPNNILARPLGLRSRVVRIDWVMIDRRFAFAGPLKTHDLFDHTGFTVKVGAAIDPTPRNAA